MLFVLTIYTYKQYVIRYKRCKLFIIHSSYQRTILLAKKKILDSTYLQLDFNDRHYIHGQ